MIALRLAVAAAATVAVAGCAGDDRDPSDATPTPTASPAAPDIGQTAGQAPAMTDSWDGAKYSDRASLSGLDFVHYHGGAGDKNFIETMGGGVVLFDYDGDDDLDAYLVQSGDLPGVSSDRDGLSHLYRNRGDGSFERVTTAAGVGNADGYGMGAIAGDYDNDGLLDLYVLNFEANRLYKNRGDGGFTDVTAAAGVGDPLWSVSAAWADFDGDGDLDLYVVNYLDFTMDNNKWCGRKSENIRAYCHPDQYDGVQPRYYRNDGDGTFTDRTAASGLSKTEGKGLGVVASDFDLDGDLDMFQANDSTVNYIWSNNGDGTFEDYSLLSGAGFNEDGKVQACMGVDAGDYDGDGLFDVFTTNLDLEYNTLYRNNGDMSFMDVSYRSGTTEVHLLNVGFGTEFVDFDLDGRLDIFVGNGHIIDNIETMNDSLVYAQPKSLYRNQDGGRFVEVGRSMPDLGRPRVTRGVAVGDIDGDGDLDLLVGNNNLAAELLVNDGAGAGNFLVVATEGRGSNRQGVGALLTVEAGGHKAIEEVRAGTSYASSSDPRVTFGLGAAAVVDRLTVRWPSGGEQRFAGLPVNAWVKLVEGEPEAQVLRTAGE